MLNGFNKPALCVGTSLANDAMNQDECKDGQKPCFRMTEFHGQGMYWEFGDKKETILQLEARDMGSRLSISVEYVLEMIYAYASIGGHHPRLLA